jgi:hypothetical protein
MSALNKFESAFNRTDAPQAYLKYQGEKVSLEELSQFPRETLAQLQLDFDLEMERLRQKILDNVENQYPDADWFTRATARLKYRGRDRDMVNRAMSLLNKREKGQRTESIPTSTKAKPDSDQTTNQISEKLQAKERQREAFERRFVNAAEVLLTQETFLRIVALAKEAKVSN